MDLPDLLRAHDAFVATDNPFQRRARLLQALWREAQGLPTGAKPNGDPLGSRIPLDVAKATLANFLTDHARAAVRCELAAKGAGSGQLIDEGRLVANLLSSQPLCFNLFAELQADPELATRVMRRLWPARVQSVSAVRFEHAPSRGDPKYTDDHSAFDVFIEHTTPAGERAFLGIEVKYHEGLDVAPARHRVRYDELTRTMRCFRAGSLEALKKKPLEQIWRDHMLLGAMLQADDGWSSGAYVFLYPEGNLACASAVAAYRDCLSDASTFEAITLERVLDAIEAETTARWPGAVRARYLGWSAIDRLLGAQ